MDGLGLSRIWILGPPKWVVSHWLPCKTNPTKGTLKQDAPLNLKPIPCTRQHLEVKWAFQVAGTIEKGASDGSALWAGSLAGCPCVNVILPIAKKYD